MRVIPGTEGRYSVSEDGLIVFSHIKQKALRQQPYEGYKRLILWYGDRYHMHRVHRLVAKTYIPNPNNYPQINHIDKDRSNNRISNLEWCTPEQNNKHKLSSYVPRVKYSLTRSKVSKLIVMLLERGVSEQEIFAQVEISPSLIKKARQNICS